MLEHEPERRITRDFAGRTPLILFVDKDGSRFARNTGLDGFLSEIMNAW